MALVNKDQLDVVRELRESVSTEKAGLERELDRMRGEAKQMADQAAMQASQINALLVDKVDLQADGIGQRERRIEHEKEVGALKASLSAKGLSAEDKERLEGMQARVKELEESEAGLQKKLESARRFIERQDAQFRAEYGQTAVRTLSGPMPRASSSTTQGMSDEDRQAYEEEIQTLKAINADQKVPPSLPPLRPR